MTTEQMDAPRLVTDAELAEIVKLMREARKWSQETLSAVSGLSVRTIQRVENGKPSDVDTRRALARAFEAEDIDTFNKPHVIPTPEQAEAIREKFEKEHLTLDNEVMTSGRVLCTHFERAKAWMCHAAVELQDGPATDFAALSDFLIEYHEAADLYTQTEKLDAYKDVQGYIDALDAAGIAVCCGVRDSKVVGQDWPDMTPLAMRVIYLIAFPKDNIPETIIVAKSLELG